MFWNSKKDSEEKNINYSQKIIDLKEHFIEELKTLKTKARSDIETWNAYIQKIGVEPIGIEQRNQAKVEGFKIPGIAFPSEYRAALVVLKKTTKATVASLGDEIKAAKKIIEEDELEDFVDHYLQKMVKKELTKYLDLNKPSTSVADIFANASTSINKFSPKKVGDKSYSIKCKTCGAARLEENQNDKCFYCGTPLFKK